MTVPFEGVYFSALTHVGVANVLHFAFTPTVLAHREQFGNQLVHELKRALPDATIELAYGEKAELAAIVRPDVSEHGILDTMLERIAGELGIAVTCRHTMQASELLKTVLHWLGMSYGSQPPPS